MSLRVEVFRRVARLLTQAFGPRLVQSLLINTALGSGIDVQQFADTFTRGLGLDPLEAALKTIGVGNHDHGKLNGENYLIEKTLHDYIQVAAPVFFDVGANIGEYALKLRSAFPGATIYAFEPNPETFALLKRNTAGAGISVIQAGCGARNGKQQLFTYADDLISEHACTRLEVLRTLHGAKRVATFEISSVTLDAFCEEHDIPRIHFLKIDTEGDELEVLKGASRLIQERRLTALQFEFNEMNVIGRVFLGDFYELLSDFEFYRLLPMGLFPLGAYSAQHEVFRYQNIFAARRPIV